MNPIFVAIDTPDVDHAVAIATQCAASPAG